MKSPFRRHTLASPLRRPQLRSAQRHNAHRRQLVRLRRQDSGAFQIEGMGIWYSYWRDPYHLMLTVPWWGFVAIVALGYVAINASFAGLYLLEPGSLKGGAAPDSFGDAFFFSVQTLASIGYGAISPQTLYANILVTLEAIASLILIAVVTGLAFARFSKPNARVVFSDWMVVTQHDNVPTLMFRMANRRRNQLLDPQLRVYVLRDETTAEGEVFYRIRELPLLRDRSPGLTLSWTAMHPITPESPLYGETPESLAAQHLQIMVTLSGVDDIAAYSVSLRHTYGHGQIRFGHRFADIMHVGEEGDRYFNPASFHQIIAQDSSS